MVWDKTAVHVPGACCRCTKMGSPGWGKKPGGITVAAFPLKQVQ